MPQQRSKMPCAASKTWCSQINNNFLKKRENTQITKIRNERGDITNDDTEIKKFFLIKKNIMNNYLYKLNLEEMDNS